MSFLKGLLFAMVLVITLNSCSDIVDSDDNILITEITYKSIKEDQENDVLLPLKAGNKWYYDVYEYDTDGTVSSSYIDSIEVTGELSLDNERWFEISNPVLSENKLNITNTDVGLWVKCDFCTNTSFLLAKHPVSSGLFASGYTNINELPIENSDYYDYLSNLTISKETGNENISVPMGNYDCVKFTSRFETDSSAIYQNPFMVEYYSVDVGLVKAVQYEILTDRIRKVFELRGPPDYTSGDCIETLNVDVGDIANNADHTESIELKNNTSGRISIIAVEFDTDNSYNLSFSNPDFENTLPLGLLPSESTTMNINIVPIQLGRFVCVIKVLYNDGCLYEITIEGNSII